MYLYSASKLNIRTRIQENKGPIALFLKGLSNDMSIVNCNKWVFSLIVLIVFLQFFVSYSRWKNQTQSFSLLLWNSPPNFENPSRQFWHRKCLQEAACDSEKSYWKLSAISSCAFSLQPKRARHYRVSITEKEILRKVSVSIFKISK